MTENVWQKIRDWFDTGYGKGPVTIAEIKELNKEERAEVKELVLEAIEVESKE